MANIYSVATQNAVQKSLDTTLAAGASSAVLNEDVSALFPNTSATAPCTAVIDRVDANGNLTPTKREYITFTGVTTTTLTGVTRNADGSGSDQEHAVGAIVEFVPDVLWAKSMSDNVANNQGWINAPEGFLINGKIVPSVASNDLTVALKGLDGNDPSATNPVYVRIGDTVHTIVTALSVTKADGTNWFNAGSTELATQEIDYFVYLGYNATDGVVIGFARIPYATAYSQFSATTTNEKYCAISTITNAAAGDNYTVVGRFAATLSAGAGYTWTVPTFTTVNLIQRPIFESRLLYWLPTYAGSGSLTYGTVNSYMGTRSGYKVLGSNVWLSLLASGTTGGTTNTTITASLPFNTYLTYGTIASWTADGAAYSGGNAALDNTKIVNVKKYDSSNWGLGTGRQISINGNISLTP